MMVANKPLNKMKCIYFRVKPAWNIQMHPLVIISKNRITPLIYTVVPVNYSKSNAVQVYYNLILRSKFLTVISLRWKLRFHPPTKKVVSEDGNLIYNEITSPQLRVYCGNGSNKEWHCNMYCWIKNKKNERLQIII